MSAIIGQGGSTVAQVLAAPGVRVNAGLEFDRYLALWVGPPADPSPAPVSREALQAFADRFNRRGGQSDLRALLAEHHRRLERATRHRGALHRDYRIHWRLASGLGASHPLGNGFAFDSTLGLPYLPGSAIKGLCRRAAELGAMAQDRIDLLLGPDESERAAVGQLVFYAALPIVWPTLVVDIVNCHHPAYYTQSMGEKHRPGPSETEEPVPVYFLAVGTPSSFRFLIGSRAADQAERVEQAEQGQAWLQEGLGLLGLGAKTAVGYGLMELESQTAAAPARWQSVTLRYKKNTGELAADQGAERATVGSVEAARLLQGLTPEARRRLERGKLKATIELRHIGAKRWQITNIDPE